MTRKGITALVFAVLLIGGCSGPAPGPADAIDTSNFTPDEAEAAERAALSRCGEVTVEGYCGVRFGMPAAEAMKVFPVKLEGYEALAGAAQAPEACAELFAVQPVRGVSFLAEGGVIGRVDVITEIVRSPEGFGVGTQASAIRTQFGDALRVSVNDLEPEITDLSIAQGAATFVYEIQDGIVRSWRVGIAPTVDYIAHCSG